MEVIEMAAGSETKNPLVVKEAKQVMSQWKYEIARELGITPPADGYWGNLTSRDCGAVGGHMVRKMIYGKKNDTNGRKSDGQQRNLEINHIINIKKGYPFGISFLISKGIYSNSLQVYKLNSGLN